MKMKKGTPLYGIIIGGGLMLLGVLVMLIGFWKTLILCALFGAGYFIGTVENKREFMKNTANKIIPDKEVKVIDLKSELIREQEMSQAAGEKAAAVEVKPVVKPEVKPVAKPEVKTASKSETNAAVKTEAKPAVKTEAKTAVKKAAKAETRAEATSEATFEATVEPTAETIAAAGAETKTEE